MNALDLWLRNVLVLQAAVFGLWLLSLRLRDASIVDIFWGPGFVLVAWMSAIATTGDPLRRGLLVGLTTLWGLRLGVYLAWRNIGKGEDPRYAAMRANHGPRFPLLSLATVFALQGALIAIVSLPIQMGQLALLPSAPTLLDVVGCCLFGVGLTFETVGDWQLARFKRDPANRGQVMDQGLWRYTRHPNYFGDFCVWWGLYAIALATGSAWWTAIGPLTMSVLLMRVSGVTLLERSLSARPGYAEYVRRTSAFFPRPPRG